MAKKETIDSKTEQKEMKVIFHNSYIGIHGNFQKDKVYILSSELFKMFKNDCKEV